MKNNNSQTVQQCEYSQSRFTLILKCVYLPNVWLAREFHRVICTCAVLRGAEYNYHVDFKGEIDGGVSGVGLLPDT